MFPVKPLPPEQQIPKVPVLLPYDPSPARKAVRPRRRCRPNWWRTALPVRLVGAIPAALPAEPPADRPAESMSVRLSGTGGSPTLLDRLGKTSPRKSRCILTAITSAKVTPGRASTCAFTPNLASTPLSSKRWRMSRRPSGRRTFRRSVKTFSVEFADTAEHPLALRLSRTWQTRPRYRGRATGREGKRK